ncbi:MAG TPA: 2-amino-3,7-dideoxy-D-threo-hept-6-ulosonate synthase [Rectinemataceae bacterium]
MIGASVRMNRIFSKADGKAVIVAIDHGGIAGPVPGIVRPSDVVGSCVKAGADAILATRGLAQASEGEWDRGTGLILRLTGGFTVLGGGFEEELICDPETALRSGADAVAMTVKFGHKREGAFIKQASLAAAACSAWGLPVMIEAMAKQEGKKANDPEGIRLAARAAQEIGADMVKTYYTGDPDSFRLVTEGCPVPVIILGGEKNDSLKSLFEDVYWSIQAGGAGVAIGRNIWAHGRTTAMVEAMNGLVHGAWSVAQALEHLGES